MRRADVLAAIAAFAASTGLVAQNASPARGAIEHIQIHGKSLESNLEGDSADRDVFIYLPPGYVTDTSRRYPVVYLLHGYGLTAERWTSFLELPQAADKVFADGRAREMILVAPDAFTRFNGSMYSSSVTTGDWEEFIARDLVSYIDGHYRTIADRMGRGLAGHSMGGYGTIRIGMKRPEVFSSIYAMSSCCLTANLTPDLQRLAPAEAITSVQDAKQNRTVLTVLAEAAAWSPNPQNPPFFLDLPVKEGRLQPSVLARWAANAPLAMIDQYVRNLRRLHALALDIGLQDRLAASNKRLHDALSQFAIPHVWEAYDGTHSNRIAERFETKILPFFSAQLSATPALQ